MPRHCSTLQVIIQKSLLNHFTCNHYLATLHARYTGRRLVNTFASHVPNQFYREEAGENHVKDVKEVLSVASLGGHYLCLGHVTEEVGHWVCQCLCQSSVTPACVQHALASMLNTIACSTPRLTSLSSLHAHHQG